MQYGVVSKSCDCTEADYECDVAWEMACMAASSGGSLPLSVRTQAQLELWCWWRLGV